MNTGRSHIPFRKWKLFPLSILFFWGSHIQGQVTVAGSNGANGIYATLGAAFTAINGPLQVGMNITVTITANTVEPATAVLNQNAGVWASLTISPSGNRIISGNIAGALIQLNGADFVTVNGLNNGVSSLQLTNSSTSSNAATIQFQNSAQNNTVTNCTITGSSTGAFNNVSQGAVVWLGTSISGIGNDNITLSNNDIGPAGTNLPYQMIKSYGTSGRENNSATITNNLIHDYFSAGTGISNSKGVLAYNYSSDWFITNNRFYQSATRTWANSGSTDFYNIYSCIDVQYGSGYTITGNICGFANASGTGNTVISNSASNYSSMLQPIIVNQSSSTSSNISNNVISGFDFTSSRAKSTVGNNIFTGIYLVAGSATITANVIGSSSATNAIILKSTAISGGSMVPAVGIYNTGNASTVTINYNTIAGIQFTFGPPGVANMDRTPFYGISNDGSGGTVNISNNTIGSNVAANITMNLNNGNFVGIRNNITAGNQVVIRKNTIQNISHSGLNSGSLTNSAIIGIMDVSSGSAPGSLISGNTIQNLNLTAATSSVVMNLCGILWYAPNGGNATIEKNKIAGLAINATISGVISGLYPASGSGTSYVINNMVAIGVGNSYSHNIYGMWIASGNQKVYNNSFRISGSGSAGSGVTAALFYGTTLTPLSLINNIFYNDRSSINWNLALYFTGAPNPAYNAVLGTNNVVYSTSTPLCRFSSTNCNSLAAWNAACGGGDPLPLSKNVTVVFASVSDLHTSDLNVRNAGISLAQVVDDIDDFIRPSCVDIGCDEYDAGSITGNTYTWLGTVDNLWCNPCNWEREVVPPSTGDIVIKDDCPYYPLLQAGIGCGNVTVHDFTVQPNAAPAKSGQIDLGAYTLTVTGNITVAGNCNCTGAAGTLPLTEGLIDVTSTTQQQILDFRNASNTYPGSICKLRINKTAPVAVAAVKHEAILKGNLIITQHLDFSNGVLLSGNGVSYNADENTAVNFKTITLTNDDPGAVTRQSIAGQNTRNGFFEGRLNRLIQASFTKNEYLYPLGYRATGGTGVVGDYFYCPSLITFSSVNNSSFLAGTFLNANTNFRVDGVWIGNTGHGCGNPFEIDDQGGQTAVTCNNAEIDMVADYYWDFSESTGASAAGDPAIAPGALGPVQYDIECAGDKFNLLAMDGLTGSELRLIKRPSIAIPDSTGMGAWTTSAGTHDGTDISANTGIAMYSITNPSLKGARRDFLDSFSGFTAAANGPSPLPVELLNFTVVKTGDNAALCRWTTASEINNDHFEVYASRGSGAEMNWTQIGSVPGYGNSSVRHDYKMPDDHPVHGKNYYRLLQVDYDGTKTWSDIVILDFSLKKSFAVTAVSPNPFMKNPEVYLYTKSGGDLHIEITGILGNLIYHSGRQLPAGSSSFTLPAGDLLPSGVYFVRFDMDGEQSVVRIVKE